MELKVRDEHRPGPPSSPATALSGRETTPRGLNPAEQVGTLSYTSLGELERCGYRYYLERVLGLPEDRSATGRSTARAEPGSARDGLDARARGTLVHRLLESADFSRPRAPSAEQIAGLARELGVHLARSEREQVAALVGVVMGGALRPLGRRLSAAESVRREHPFALSLRPHEPVLTGVIDVLAREVDGGVLIVDYKTDRVGGEVDLAALTERDYGAQRLLYALAALRDGAPKVEIVHWFLERPDEWIGAQFDPADRRELEERLAARIDRVRARGFSVSSDPHKALCETCPGRARLCSWSDADTGRQLPAAGERLGAA